MVKMIYGNLTDTYVCRKDKIIAFGESEDKLIGFRFDTKDKIDKFKQILNDFEEDL